MQVMAQKLDQNLHLQFDEIVDDVYKEILKKTW